jgi:hypothetical protein
MIMMPIMGIPASVSSAHRGSARGVGGAFW